MLDLFFAFFLNLHIKVSFAQETSQHGIKLQFEKNFATSFSEINFSQGYIFPTLSYHYLDKNNFDLSLGGGFKIIRYMENKKPFALLTLSQKISKKILIYHKHHILIGPSWLHLTPFKSLTFPLNREKNFRTEFGAGAQIFYEWQIHPLCFLEFGGERWRGVNSNTFHFFAFSLGFKFLLQPQDVIE